MSVKVLINHQTVYSYDRLVSLSTQVIRLFPAVHNKTSIIEYSLTVKPLNHMIYQLQDPYGNTETRINFNNRISQFEINVVIVASIEPVNPFQFFIESYASHYPFIYRAADQRPLALYMEVSKAGPLLESWIARLDFPSTEIVDFIAHINRSVYRDIHYHERIEPGVQTAEQSLERRTGSCRDSAWLLVQILRQFKLASRFVSGYIVQLGNNGDTTGLHAWAEVYIPGAGWIGLDPSNGLFAAEGYIPMACVPEYENAAAVNGASDIAIASLTHVNSVVRM